MRFSKSISIRNLIFLCATVATGFPTSSQHPLFYSSNEAPVSGNHNVSVKLFTELEELARLVDIAYCVGMTGIQAPFECASRCDEFPGYELIDVCLRHQVCFGLKELCPSNRSKPPTLKLADLEHRSYDV